MEQEKIVSGIRYSLGAGEKNTYSHPLFVSNQTKQPQFQYASICFFIPHIADDTLIIFSQCQAGTPKILSQNTGSWLGSKLGTLILIPMII